MLKMQKKRSNLAGSLTRKLAGPLLAGQILFVGCATGPISDLPPCPVPSYMATSELSMMYLSGTSLLYEDLILWIGEIERYCSAIRESQG